MLAEGKIVTASKDSKEGEREEREERREVSGRVEGVGVREVLVVTACAVILMTAWAVTTRFGRS